MPFDAPKVFVTAQIAKLLRVPEWRIIKFVGGKEYGIKPALSEAAGSGTRRMYDLENVCEMALAWWLFQAGLRSDVVGWILHQVRNERPLKAILDMDEEKARSLYLAVTRTERKGWYLVPRQEIAYLQSHDQIQNLLTASAADSGFVLLPVGIKLMNLKSRLRKLSKDLKVKE
jgi:hypothetical protein